MAKADTGGGGLNTATLSVSSGGGQRRAAQWVPLLLQVGLGAGSHRQGLSRAGHQIALPQTPVLTTAVSFAHFDKSLKRRLNEGSGRFHNHEEGKRPLAGPSPG